MEKEQIEDSDPVGEASDTRFQEKNSSSREGVEESEAAYQSNILEQEAEGYKEGLGSIHKENLKLEEMYQQLSDHALVVRDSINENSEWFMEHQGVENKDVKFALSEVIKKSDDLKTALTALNRLAANSRANTIADTQDVHHELKNSEFKDDPNSTNETDS